MSSSRSSSTTRGGLCVVRKRAYIKRRRRQAIFRASGDSFDIFRTLCRQVQGAIRVVSVWLEGAAANVFKSFCFVTLAVARAGNAPGASFTSERAFFFPPSLYFFSSRRFQAAGEQQDGVTLRRWKGGHLGAALSVFPRRDGDGQQQTRAPVHACSHPLAVSCRKTAHASL